MYRQMSYYGQPRNFRRISTKKSIIFLVIYVFVTFILPRIIVSVFSGNTIEFAAGLNNFSYIILTITSIILFKDVYKDMGREIKSHPLMVIGVAFLGGSAIFVLNILSTLIYNTGEKPENQQGVELVLSTGFFVVITIVVLGPVVEEFMFRYILVGKLGEYIPKWLAGVISVMIFGFVHVQKFSVDGLLEARPYLIVGAVITFVYLKQRKELAYPLAVHVLNNLFATIMMFAAKALL